MGGKASNAQNLMSILANWCQMVLPISAKGVFNLSNQLSNFLKDWGMLRSETEFNRNSRANFTIFFCYSRSKIAMTLSILTGEHIKLLGVVLETMIWGD